MTSSTQNSPAIVYRSPGRGKPLICQTPNTIPVLTMENCEKWYSLYLLHPDGAITEVDRDLVLDCVERGEMWVDHIYHPNLLKRVAKRLDGCVDVVSLEVAAGRWVMEKSLLPGIHYHDLYDEEEQ